MLTGNQEHALTVSYDAAGNPTFTTGTGPAGDLSLDGWSAPAGVSSIIHTHYADPYSLSVFSEGDLQFLWDYYSHSGGPANPGTFTFSIITASGTVYSLAVTNPAAFATFANNYDLSNLQSSLLKRAYDSYHISSTNTAADNERWFLKMLGILNTGLTMYKGDPNNLASWQKLSLTKNAVTASPCN